MKLVIQRVKSASVSIDGQVYNAIQQGLLLLVGVGPEGWPEGFGLCGPQVSQMRISQMRKIRWIFRSKDIQGEILSISQFTLFADTKRQPSCFYRGCQIMASQLYDAFNDQLEKEVPVKRGIFWGRYGDWIDQWWSSDDFVRYKKSISKNMQSD